jgi:pimeloyl-ACP methyl ester carboxylesterase
VLRVVPLAAFWIAAALAGTAVAQPGAPLERDDPADSAPFNLTLPTLGGRQFWADQLVFRGWRVQQNIVTGHCRLLDEKNFRHAWGTFEQCRAKLDAIRRQERLQPVGGNVVLVLHGMFASRTCADEFVAYLEEQGGYTAYCISYPSTRADIDFHAASLSRIVEHLEGADRIHFVAHSLGSLIVRRYLATATDEATGRRPDPRIGRIVMLGPPNQGAKFADAFDGNGLFDLLAGKSAKQMAGDFPRVAGRLATPRCEFGIIAGGVGRPNGGNPLLAGDDDLVVTVEETRLAGASDFIVLPVVHVGMFKHETVQECTLRFLQHGYFVNPERRQALAPGPGESDIRRE